MRSAPLSSYVKLGGAVATLRIRLAAHRDLDRVEKWADSNPVKVE